MTLTISYEKNCILLLHLLLSTSLKCSMMFIVMKRVILKFLLVWSLLFLISFSLAAQKHFSLIVNLPQGIHNEKVEAWLQDGRQTHRIKASPTGQRQVTLTGEYVFLYAA